jgi:hypothetical protein
VEPVKAWEQAGSFCGAGRLLDRARLLLGVASRGKLLLIGPGPRLPASDIAAISFLSATSSVNPLLPDPPALRRHATAEPVGKILPH